VIFFKFLIDKAVVSKFIHAIVNDTNLKNLRYYWHSFKSLYNKKNIYFGGEVPRLFVCRSRL
jgi:hypothetical protein